MPASPIHFETQCQEYLDKINELTGAFKQVMQDYVTRSSLLLTRAENSIYKDAVEFIDAFTAVSLHGGLDSRRKLASAYSRFRANTSIKFARDVCHSEKSIARSESVRAVVEKAIGLYNSEIGVTVETSDKTPSELLEMLQNASIDRFNVT